MLYILCGLFLIIYLIIGYRLYRSTRSSYKPIIVWWLPLILLMGLIRVGVIPFGCISNSIPKNNEDFVSV